MDVRLFRPYLDEDDLKSIKKAFDINWLGNGSFVKEFEDNLDAGRLARKRIEKKYPLSFRTKAFQTFITQAENV